MNTFNNTAAFTESAVAAESAVIDSAFAAAIALDTTPLTTQANIGTAHEGTDEPIMSTDSLADVVGQDAPVPVLKVAKVKEERIQALGASCSIKNSEVIEAIQPSEAARVLGCAHLNTVILNLKQGKSENISNDVFRNMGEATDFEQVIVMVPKGKIAEISPLIEGFNDEFIKAIKAKIVADGADKVEKEAKAAEAKAAKLILKEAAELQKITDKAEKLKVKEEKAAAKLISDEAAKVAKAEKKRLADEATAAAAMAPTIGATIADATPMTSIADSDVPVSLQGNPMLTAEFAATVAAATAESVSANTVSLGLDETMVAE